MRGVEFSGHPPLDRMEHEGQAEVGVDLGLVRRVGRLEHGDNVAEAGDHLPELVGGRLAGGNGARGLDLRCLSLDPDLGESLTDYDRVGASVERGPVLRKPVVAVTKLATGPFRSRIGHLVVLQGVGQYAHVASSRSGVNRPAIHESSTGTIADSRKYTAFG